MEEPQVTAPESNSEAKSKSNVQRQLWILGLFPLSEHIAWASTFSYIYAMVKSLNETSNEKGDSTAIYASLLVSCFTFGEFLMAPQWARISDRIGRKPTLLVGSLGATCAAIVFGLSSSLTMALVARFLAGALNPNLGVLKTYVGELVDRETQAKGFSSLLFMAGLGIVCGPVVGGYLAEPAKTMPSIFHPGSIWDKFPYLLPNLLVAVCLAISNVLGVFFLQEVHPEFRDREDVARRILSSLCVCFDRRTKRKSTSSSPSPAVDSENTRLIDEEGNPEPAKSTPTTTTPTFSYREAFTKQILLQILSTTLEDFKDIATLSLVPIFLASPQPPTPNHPTFDFQTDKRTLGGGFDLNTQSTSNILLTQAIASILWQILVIPRLITTQGPLRSYRLTLATCILLYVLMPLTLLLPGPTGLFSFTLLLWTLALLMGTSSTATSIMITNNCPAPRYLATVNGVAASCGCLAKTAGPAVVGVLYDRGVQAGNVVVPFWTLGAGVVLTLGLTGYLRE